MSASAVILVVDDDERLRRTVSNYLRAESFQVLESGTGEQMRKCLAGETVDLIILDLMLPDESGLNLARELRARSDVAIIMLTGKVETVDRIVGLEIGADDYVTKPFDHRELLARVRTVLRRAPKSRRQTNTVPVSSVRFEGWVLDLVTQELNSAEGRVVHLTSHQYQLLASLVTHADRPLSRSEISNLLAGRDWSPLNRSVDVLVSKLRKKIEKDPKSPKLIKTVRGVGYKFAARVKFTG
jgi:DNA-binding response OmpR family regulator